MTRPSVETRRACGAARARVRFRIRDVLERQHLTMTALAEQIGVCNQAVSNTVNGRLHSPKVLQALRDVGVPEKYLFDPAKVCAKGPDATEGKVA
ncbi:hypothetical protein DA2_3767 [Desulfovibrio sp. A2]|nr:hypothetical protein DA2_3767 [Desulfovibrio sp. A2]HEU6435831.1 helix-turn-helix transcriptional regulator [Nitratidesulfovibrio sp.]